MVLINAARAFIQQLLHATTGAQRAYQQDSLFEQHETFVVQAFNGHGVTAADLTLCKALSYGADHLSKSIHAAGPPCCIISRT